LEDHRHAFVTGVLRHQLGLGAEVLKVECWRYRHKQSIALLKSLRNRLSAGLRGITHAKPAENKD
jgi:hypothetical protein